MRARALLAFGLIALYVYAGFTPPDGMPRLRAEIVRTP